MQQRVSTITAGLRSLGPVVRLAPRLIVNRRPKALCVRPDLIFLSERVRKMPRSAVIAQAQPVVLDETLALVAGCWGSDRRIHVEWPPSLVRTSEGREDFVAWHRDVIRRGVLPYVVITDRITDSGQTFERAPQVPRPDRPLAPR